MSKTTRAGYVAIAGRPNVGKSTLLNHILGSKLSITSRKPQTTRQRILGVHTTGSVQIAFIDTPGLHAVNKKTDTMMNRYMNQQAIGSLEGVDLCLHVIDAAYWTEDDSRVVDHLETARADHAICVLNKVDHVHPKSKLIPVMDEAHRKFPYLAIVPTAAVKNHGLDILVSEIAKYMPESTMFFDEHTLTDKPLRYFVGEIIREQIIRQLGAELPYRTTVVVERCKDQDAVTLIDATIYVEKESQKGIVIGKGGQRLKSIGKIARQSIERLIEGKSYLDLRVRTRPNWTNERQELMALGYR